MAWRGRYPPRPFMTEEMLMKFAQPMLIGIGLIFVMSAGTLLSIIWQAWTSRNSKLDKVEGLVIKMTFEIEQLQKDLNNVGKAVREIRNGREEP